MGNPMCVVHVQTAPRPRKTAGCVFTRTTLASGVSAVVCPFPGVCPVEGVSLPSRMYLTSGLCTNFGMCPTLGVCPSVKV